MAERDGVILSEANHPSDQPIGPAASPEDDTERSRLNPGVFAVIRAFSRSNWFQRDSAELSWNN
jgi:hypothetical protein